jgi:hypothetical protein
VISLVHSHNNSLAFRECIRYPPCESSLGEIGDEMVSLPVVAWDVSAIELDGDSDADNNA